MAEIQTETGQFEQAVDTGIDPYLGRWIDMLFGDGITEFINNRQFPALDNFEPSVIVNVTSFLNDAGMVIIALLFFIQFTKTIFSKAIADKGEFKGNLKYYLRCLLAFIMLLPMPVLNISILQSTVLSLAGVGAGIAQWSWNRRDVVLDKQIVGTKKSINANHIVKQLWYANVCAESFAKWGSRLPSDKRYTFPEAYTTTETGIEFGENGRCGSITFYNSSTKHEENHELYEINERLLTKLNNTVNMAARHFIIDHYEANNLLFDPGYSEYTPEIYRESVGQLPSIAITFKTAYERAYSDVVRRLLNSHSKDNKPTTHSANMSVATDSASSITSFEDSFIYAGGHFKRIAEVERIVAEPINHARQAVSFKYPTPKKDQSLTVGYMADLLSGEDSPERNEILDSQYRDIATAERLWKYFSTNSNVAAGQNGEAVGQTKIEDLDMKSLLLDSDSSSALSTINIAIYNSSFADIDELISKNANPIQIVINTGERLSTAGSVLFTGGMVGSLGASIPIVGSSIDVLIDKIMIAAYTLEGLGAYMQVILPNMFILIWLTGIASWLISVLIAFIAAIFIPIALAIPTNDDGIFTNQYTRTGVEILIRMIATPFLLVFGMFVSIIASYIIFYMFSAMYSISSQPTSQLITTLAAIAFYVYAVNQIIIMAFQITARLPSMVLEYFTPGAVDRRAESDSQSMRETEHKTDSSAQTSAQMSAIKAGRGAGGSVGKGLSSASKKIGGWMSK